SLGDVQMNIELVKYCATVLFLESSQSDNLTENSMASLNATNSIRHNENASLNGTASNTSPISHNRNIENHTIPPNHIAQVDTMDPPEDKMETENLQSNEAMIAESSTTTLSDAVSNHSEIVEPDAVSLALITVNIAPFFHGSPKLQILYRNIPMQIRCDGMRVRIPTVTEDSSRWMTEIYHKESSLSSSIQPLVSSRYNVAELDSLFRPGSLVYANFSLDPYNYQQNAGIRLVAKKLIVYNN
ncbi:hypothetical protein Tco_1074803, partial [Tanacetum coccineum]